MNCYIVVFVNRKAMGDFFFKPCKMGRCQRMLKYLIFHCLNHIIHTGQHICLDILSWTMPHALEGVSINRGQ